MDMQFSMELETKRRRYSIIQPIQLSDDNVDIDDYDNEDCDENDDYYGGSIAEQQQLIRNGTGRIIQIETSASTTSANGSMAGYIGGWGNGAAAAAARSNRHSSKRLTTWTVMAFGLFSLLLLVYIPLSNNVNTQRIEPIPGWNKNTTRNIAHYVLPHLNTTIISPMHVCIQTKVFLLIVVCSSSVNFELRQSIRETWGNISDFNYSKFAKMHQSFKGNYLDIKFNRQILNGRWNDHMNDDNNNGSNDDDDDNNDANNNINAYDASQQINSVKILFLIGQTLNNDTQHRIYMENDLYGDIIQETFIDSYNNLTLKSIMMLKWVNDNCHQKVKYLMKCDDDTFVNVPNILHVLMGGTIPVYNATLQEYDQVTVKATSSINRMTQQHQLLLGIRFCNSKPIANISSKWYTPMYMYDGNTYPNYLSGAGYVMSMDVVQKLYNASLTTPLFHLEDVYVTGICAKQAQIVPRNHQLFSYTSFQRLCELRGMICKHEMNVSRMRQAYEFVTNASAICAKPDKLSRVRKIKSRQHCN